MRKYTQFLRMLTAAIFLLAAPAYATSKLDSSAAVIFVYQRVGEDSIPDSNISTEQFKEHMAELQKGGYAVLPLSRIIDKIRAGDTLPPKTVGITFEGAYHATLTNTLPLLNEAKLPFTVFFASDMADGSTPTHMNWKDLKKLSKDKLVSLGIFPASYEHMVNKAPEENAALINRAVARYRDMLGHDPVFFAYPYGEFSNTLKKQMARYKFKAVFGQQSGVAHAGADFLALPRFTMTDEFGDLDRFLLTANALPLPVSDVVPEDAVLTKNPPQIGFTISPDVGNTSKLACFVSGNGKISLIRLEDNRIELRPAQPFTDRRTRINCTLADAEAKRWRWFGRILINPGVSEDTGVDLSLETQSPESQ